jgi:xylulose-5-phosphate/fructose-6-phosphate phosphoketolase
VSVTTPGSIHEGGELGYVLVHAFGAVMDNPDLIALAVVGDGEAETGPLEGSWKGISFLNPVHDGAVLPVLHLNGAKIAGPTVLARKDPAEVRSCSRGTATRCRGRGRRPARHAPPLRGGDGPAWTTIRRASRPTREGGGTAPAAALADDRAAHAQGLDRPEEVDGIRVTGTWRSHQVPLSGVRATRPPAVLETWLRSYRPEELFDEDGRPTELVLRCQPRGRPADERDAARQRRPAARTWTCRTSATTPSTCRTRPRSARESTRARRADARRLPAQPGQLPAVLPRRDQQQPARRGVRGPPTAPSPSGCTPDDLALSHDGRVMEVLSEHNCHGWLEGYTADRPARAVRDVRGVRDGQRVADDPARQVAAGGAQPAVAGDGPEPEHPADLDRLAQRPQRLLPPGPRLIQNVITQRGEVAGSTCRRTPTACCRWPTTACARGRTST